MTSIRVFDYIEQYRQLEAEIRLAIERVLLSGKLILGSEVERFESAMAEALGGGHGVGVGNGTDALVLALRGLGVQPGDEVITVANTAVPTVSAIRQSGADVVFCDVDERSALLDLEQIEACFSNKTRAVVAVHLFGNVLDVPRLRAQIGSRPIAIVEDCAQAAGAALNGRPVGSLGDVSAFSFYPTKNLGAYGDGGLCFTADEALARVIRSLRMYGFEGSQHAEREGQNSRLDELQAAILNVKLPHLQSWVERRRQLAALYTAHLKPQIQRLQTTAGAAHAYHLFVVRVPGRDAVQRALAEVGIQTGIHYPCPIHRMRGYAFMNLPKGSLPVTERLSDEILSLPIYPELPQSQVERVIEALNRVV
jgi:dTDP-3-amino-2,3,6-trideoxy-4-keto-D-glucose/dTDP-3-amino-3,4,6-trideoxy-alpha-D-glucose/dTDP-2,6-dideoxy-D-kanosamine transaminase